MTKDGAQRRGAPPSLAGARVLVVDAVDDARELYALVLGGAGADVRRATSSAEAFASLKDWRAQVAVVGVERDEGETLAFVEALLERHAELRLVAVTADALARTRQRLLAHGFHACLPLPVHPTELRWAVADALP